MKKLNSEEYRQNSVIVIMHRKNSFFLSIIFSIIVFLFGNFLASCSLKPIYGERVIMTANSPLNFIEINSINSVEGSELLYHLSNIMPLRGEAKYLLHISLSYEITPILIQKNTDVLRQTLSQVVEYQLRSKDDNIVTKGKFTHITSYASTFSPYTSHIESEEALKNLSRQAAEDIRTRLILFFSKNPNNL